VTPDPAIIARAAHVFGVVLWIGGVGFVTTVLLPSVRRLKTPPERVQFFEAIEGRFAWQARITTLIVGASGFYLWSVGTCGHASTIHRGGGCTPWSACGRSSR
jgi:uncharacterized membrane protein